MAYNCLQDEQIGWFRVHICQKWYIVIFAVRPAINKKLNWTRMFWNVLRLILFCQQKSGLVFFQCSVWRWQPAAKKTHVQKKLLSADMVGGTSVNLTYGDTVVPSWSNRGTSGFENQERKLIGCNLVLGDFFFCWGEVLRGWVKVVMATNGLFVDYESSESRWKSDSKFSTSPWVNFIEDVARFLKSQWKHTHTVAYIHIYI